MRDGPRELMLRSENGAPMKSVTLLSKMYELGVTPSRGTTVYQKTIPYAESLFIASEKSHQVRTKPRTCGAGR
ncbi:hypothetical protein F6S08_26135 [Pseudomonas sp. JV449]|nr:hypothetical protein [Pseudomonas sp. JV449]